MTSLERRSVGVLSAIYALRMVGLFLIFPVFALYAENLSGQTTLLIGIALLYMAYRRNLASGNYAHAT